MYYTSACLMSCKYQYFGNLNMFRSRGCIECHICDIFASKWFYTFVYLSARLLSPWKRTLLKFVSTSPGLRFVTLTADSATSILKPSVIALTAALVAQYTLPPAYAASPATLPTFITCPSLRFTIPGTIKRVIVSNPLTLVSIMVLQSSMSPSYSFSSPSAILHCLSARPPFAIRSQVSL